MVRASRLSNVKVKPTMSPVAVSVLLFVHSMISLMAASTIDCTGQRACFDETLICPGSGADCSVVCDGYFSCKKATVWCAPGTNCDIDCTGDEVCRELTVDAKTASRLTVRCLTPDQESCSSVAIYCPVNGHAGDIACHISGITSDNAKSSEVRIVHIKNDVNRYNKCRYLLWRASTTSRSAAMRMLLLR